MLNLKSIQFSSESFFVLVGRNGSGKSSMLNELSLQSLDSKYNTIVVSNTLFDKFHVFPTEDSYNYIGSKLGRNFPSQAIKKTISTENESRINRIFNVLDYIHYDQAIGMKIKFRRKFVKAIRFARNSIGESYRIYFENSDTEIPEEVMIAIDKSINQINFGCSHTVWLKAEDNVFKEGDFRSYLLLLKHEKLLKKAKIISGIDVYLSKNDYSFPLNHASSGELSFIALLVHIAFCMEENSFIFIDEPENSLHPKWQSAYLDILNGAIGYYKCKVVVATHSPLIIGSFSESDDVTIYKCDVNGFNTLKANDDSAEELYLEFFDTLTPKNRTLSNRCVDIIDQYSNGELSLIKAEEKLAIFYEMTNDEAQREFLTGVGDLLNKISKGIKS
ncbi:ATP-binding protein [Pantoea vagans]|uniref:ATP-binding protein n=1 Tax=Pantoea vagans TaxID=470934 RepID=A0ABY3LL35_9GAMM|nr:ATP-binding protein [Pantoea vagans]